MPGYTSLFTGLYPTSHDIVAHGNRWPLRNGVRMLAGYLHDAGYETAQVSSLADYGKGGEHLIAGCTRHAFKDLDPRYSSLNPSF